MISGQLNTYPLEEFVISSSVSEVKFENHRFYGGLTIPINLYGEYNQFTARDEKNSLRLNFYDLVFSRNIGSIVTGLSSKCKLL